MNNYYNDNYDDFKDNHPELYTEQDKDDNEEHECHYCPNKKYCKLQCEDKEK